MKYYDDKTKHALTVYLFIFFLLVMGIVISGYVSYHNFEQEFHRQAENQISAIAELKANELVNWRKERLGDAASFYHDPVLSELVERYFENMGDVEARSQLLSRLGNYQSYGQYDRICLLDVTGTPRLSVPTELEAVDTCLVIDATSSLNSDRVVLGDFQRDTKNTDGDIHISILAPVFADQSNNRPLGILVLHIDPETYLYPYITQSPIPSDTAETLLVRRDGEDVLFLNELRFQQGAALTLRYPLTDIDVPAVQAVLGKTGIVEGVDYRGEPVLADVRAIPDSPWFLISKVDIAEVRTPLGARLWQTLLIIGMAIFVAGTGLALVWRQQRSHFYRTQALVSEALRASEEKFRKAFILSPDSININRLQDGMYVSINNGFTKIMGYTADESIGKTSLELNIWVNPQDRKALVDGLIKNGEIENLEACFRAKNGEIVYGLMSASVLEFNGTPHIINITRDITERKQTEEAIKESEASLRSLLNNRNESIWSLDENYNFITFNSFFSEAYFASYKIKLEKGMNAIKILTPELQAFWKPKYDSALSGRKMAFEFSTQIEDNLNYYEVSLNPIVSDGIVSGLSAISIDITERKQAEERLEQFFSINLDLLCVADLEGNFIKVNKAWESILGYSTTELEHRKFLDFVHPEDMESTLEAMSTLGKQKQVLDFVNRFRCMDGSYRFVEWRSQPSGNFIYAAARDITERKQTEDALRESEEKMRSIFRVAPTGIGVVRDRVLYEVNPRICEMTGYTKDELTGQSARILYATQEEFEWVGSEKYKQIAEKGSGVVEARWQKKDGSTIDVLLASTPIDLADISKGVTFTVLDITERKRSEEALKESEAIFSSFLEHSPVYVFFKDKDIRSLRLSKNYEQMLGMPIDDLIGKTMDDLFPSDLAKSMTVDDQRILNEGKRITVVEEFNGRVYETTKFPVFKDGEPYLLAGFTLDITERKQAEKALEKSEALYHDLVETSQDLIWQCNAEGEYTYLNPAWEQVFGYKIEEMLGKKFTDFQTPQMAARDQKEFSRLMQGNAVKGLETIHIGKSGNEIQLAFNAKYLTDENGKTIGTRGTAYDITARKRAEASLIESENLYRAMNENSPLGMHFYKLNNNNQLVFVGANPAADKLLGVDNSQFIEKTIEEAFPPLAQTEVPQRYLDAAANGTPWSTEQITYKDGRNEGAFEVKAFQTTPRNMVVMFADITARKQTEDSLRQYTSMLEEAEKNANLGSWAFDPTTGEGWWSKQMYRMFGYDISSNVPSFKEHLNHIHPEDRQLVQDVLLKMAQGEEPVIHVYRTNPEYGPVRYFLPTQVVKRDMDGKPLQIIGTLLDITERKLAEKALRENEEMFRVAFDNAPTGMSIIGAVGFNFLAVNPLLCDMFGYTREEFLGNTIKLVTHPDDVERSNEWIRKKYNNEPCEPDFEKRYIHKDGHIVWGLVRAQWIRNEDGSPRMAINHILDITKRKQAEEALRESEALYRKAIEVANAVPYRQSYHVGGVSVDYDFMGEGIRQITGYGPEEFTETLWDSLTQERFLLDDLAKYSFDDAIERVRSGVAPVWKCEHRIRARDGSIHWVFEAAVELRDQNGNSHGSIGLFQDITARKLAEEEIHKLNAELEQRVHERTVQLETINKELEAFSYSVSHDLRAPLRGIDGWSQALLEDYHDHLDEQGRQYIDRVRSETQRMGHLIDDMLKLSRLTRAEMTKEQVDLSALAQAIAGRLKQDEPHRQVDFNISAGLTAEGDLHLLEAVLTNLLGNAFKFTANRKDARIEFGQTESLGECVFFIRDNGAGFDMDYAQKLFGAFQRMHKASEFPGTGVGLATVQRIIHRHGGRVWAEAEIGRGATFYFTLG